MMDAAAQPRTVGVRQLRANLSALLREARDGQPIQVVSRGKVLAEIRAPSAPSRKPRVPGALKGKIWMADDFDTWPEDILQSFEREL